MAVLQPALQKTHDGAASAVADTERLIFTVRPASGEIVDVEKIDSTGARGDLSEEEYRDIAAGSGEEIESALEAGFEAGIGAIVQDDDLLERFVLLQLLVSRRDEPVVQNLRRTMLRRMLFAKLLRRRISQSSHGDLEDDNQLR